MWGLEPHITSSLLIRQCTEIRESHKVSRGFSAVQC